MKKKIIILSMVCIACICSACGKNTVQTSGNAANPKETINQPADTKTPSTNLPKATDTNTKEINKNNTVSQENVLPLEVKEFGYTISDGGYLHYSIALYNPNETIAFDLPSFRITARDADGILLGTDDQTLSIIYPGETFVFGSQAFKCDENPTDVKAEPLSIKENNIKNISSLKRPEHKSFEVINTAMRENKFVGEVYNPNDYDYSKVAITVVFRDNSGNLTGGYTHYVNDLSANSTIPFEMSIYSFLKTDNYEVYANIWD